MKKLFAIILTILVMTSLFSFAAFAEEAALPAPTAGTVLRVTATAGDSTTLVGDYTDFAEGWEAAVDYAEDEDFMEENDIDRIVVDFYADWKANEDGEFGKSSWTGFRFSTIYVPSDTRITINLGGHKIDRGLGDNNEYDGEVIFVSDNADLIINGGKSGDPFVKPSENPNNIPMGTISGGNSDNGAGGIHISDGARVTLNNVNIKGNTVDDEDGSGIAAYNGAILTVNGGSISSNTLWTSFMSVAWSSGGIYLNNASAFLNGVEFAENIFRGTEHAEGVAIFAKNSSVIAENCTFKGNGYKDPKNNILFPMSVITVEDSSLDLRGCLFEGNGQADYAKGPDLIVARFGGNVRISNSIFRNNASESAISCRGSLLEVTDSSFEGTTGNVFNGYAAEGSFFTNCTFTNNTVEKLSTFWFDEDNMLSFNNCEFDKDTTFNDRTRATFDGKAGVGSIFGEGSATMIFSILALVAAVASIFLTVYYNKKKSAPVAPSNEDTDDEE